MRMHGLQIFMSHQSRYSPVHQTDCSFLTFMCAFLLLHVILPAVEAVAWGEHKTDGQVGRRRRLATENGAAEKGGAWGSLQQHKETVFGNIKAQGKSKWFRPWCGLCSCMISLTWTKHGVPRPFHTIKPLQVRTGPWFSCRHPMHTCIAQRSSLWKSSIRFFWMIENDQQRFDRSCEILMVWAQCLHVIWKIQENLLHWHMQREALLSWLNTRYTSLFVMKLGCFSLLSIMIMRRHKACIDSSLATTKFKVDWNFHFPRAHFA